MLNAARDQQLFELRRQTVASVRNVSVTNHEDELVIKMFIIMIWSGNMSIDMEVVSRTYHCDDAK